MTDPDVRTLDAKFLVPDEVPRRFDAGIGARGAEARRRWQTLFAAYREQFPELAAEIDQMQRSDLPTRWDRNLPSFPADPKGLAGRDATPAATARGTVRHAGVQKTEQTRK